MNEMLKLKGCFPLNESYTTRVMRIRMSFFSSKESKKINKRIRKSIYIYPNEPFIESHLILSFLWTMFLRSLIFYLVTWYGC